MSKTIRDLLKEDLKNKKVSDIKCNYSIYMNNDYIIKTDSVIGSEDINFREKKFIFVRDLTINKTISVNVNNINFIIHHNS